jgi:hypothetical protein
MLAARIAGRSHPLRRKILSLVPEGIREFFTWTS